MSITHHSYIVVNLNPVGVSGWPSGLAMHRLRFSIHYDIPAQDTGYIARNFRASVTLSIHDRPAMTLGTAWPEAAWVVQTGKYAHQGSILFDLDLTPEQFALIERNRNGGGMVFALKVLCETSRGESYESSSDEVRFNVNQSAWLACMKAFGMDRIVVLEVELPPTVNGLESAIELLNNARAHLDGGNYVGVVQECRRAIESVQKSFDLKPAIESALRNFCQDRKGMNKRDRALVLNAAAIHYAHPAHHVNDEGLAFDYGRRDALFMLALASAVVANGAC